jgi:hypothetical protein
LGACDSAGKATFNVTFDQAGKIGISVGPNKTIIGLGPTRRFRARACASSTPSAISSFAT